MGRFDVVPRQPAPTSWREAIWPSALTTPDALAKLPAPKCAYCGQPTVGHDVYYFPDEPEDRDQFGNPDYPFVGCWIAHAGWIALPDRVSVDGADLVALKLTAYSRDRADYARGQGFRSTPRGRTKITFRSEAKGRAIKSGSPLPLLMECSAAGCHGWNLIRELTSIPLAKTALR